MSSSRLVNLPVDLCNPLTWLRVGTCPINVCQVINEQEQIIPGGSGMPVRCRGSEEAEVTEGGKSRETEAGAESRELFAAGSTD